MTTFTAFDLSFEADVTWDEELRPQIEGLRCRELGTEYEAAFMLGSASLSHILYEALCESLYHEECRQRNEWLADRAT